MRFVTRIPKEDLMENTRIHIDRLFSALERINYDEEVMFLLTFLYIAANSKNIPGVDYVDSLKEESGFITKAMRKLRV